MGVMVYSEIAVRVTPRARTDAIFGERDGVLLVRVSAPPVDGQANASVCRLIATQAGVRPRAVTVIRGVRSRDKVVRVEALGTEELRTALGLGAGPPR